MKPETMEKVEKVSRSIETLWYALLELYVVASPFILLALVVFLVVTGSS